jgi:thiosulfate/3-mercaptopyruvate sulfurtransferase
VQLAAQRRIPAVHGFARVGGLVCYPLAMMRGEAHGQDRSRETAPARPGTWPGPWARFGALGVAAALLVAACADDGDMGAAAASGGSDSDGTSASASDGASEATAAASTTGATGSSSSDTSGAAGTATDSDTAPPCADSGGRADCPAAPVVIAADALRRDLAAVQVLDVRSLAAWQIERIPGSVALDAASLRAEVDGVRGQVAPIAVTREVLRAAGLRAGVPVVVVGEPLSLDAARVVWTLRYYGEPDAAALDGGWSAWIAAGGPTSTAPAPAIAPGDWTEQAVGDPALRVDAGWVADHLDDPQVVLFDARMASEYEAGHLPGARSVEWTRNLADGRLLPPDTLALLYELAAAAPAPELTLVAYCQTGSRAAMTWLALRWLGYRDVRLYDGSWEEWSQDPSRPVETGP